MLEHTLILKSDELYLAGGALTDGSSERASGLYLRDTRYLDLFDVRLNGLPLNDWPHPGKPNSPPVSCTDHYLNL